LRISLGSSAWIAPCVPAAAPAITAAPNILQIKTAATVLFWFPHDAPGMLGATKLQSATRDPGEQAEQRTFGKVVEAWCRSHPQGYRILLFALEVILRVFAVI
jgi:hypothetical protein